MLHFAWASPAGETCQNVWAAPALHWEDDMTKPTLTWMEAPAPFISLDCASILRRAGLSHHSPFMTRNAFLLTLLWRRWLYFLMEFITNNAYGSILSPHCLNTALYRCSFTRYCLPGIQILQGWWMPQWRSIQCLCFGKWAIMFFWPFVSTPNHTLALWQHSPSNILIFKLLTAFIYSRL